MAISKDLFLAILSMDAYNRGYGAGIDGLSDATDGDPIRIGNATISFNLQDADMASSAQAVGFYAIAYELTGSYANPDGTSLAAGDTVISYRG